MDVFLLLLCCGSGILHRCRFVVPFRGRFLWALRHDRSGVGFSIFVRAKTLLGFSFSFCAKTMFGLRHSRSFFLRFLYDCSPAPSPASNTGSSLIQPVPRFFRRIAFFAVFIVPPLCGGSAFYRLSVFLFRICPSVGVFHVKQRKKIFAGRGFF